MTAEEIRLLLDAIDHEFWAMVIAAMDDDQLNEHQALQGLIWSAESDFTVH